MEKDPASVIRRAALVASRVASTPVSYWMGMPVQEFLLYLEDLVDIQKAKK